jgi:hypothetical protein
LPAEQPGGRDRRLVILPAHGLECAPCHVPTHATAVALGHCYRAASTPAA